MADAASEPLTIRYGVRSDVGLVREGNEDSAYAGGRLLAVADGMGGHAHGEVASATVIEALRPLDTVVPDEELLSALEQAVLRAGSTMHEMIEADPALSGMGTTLTALLWSGPKLGLVHIGDSRAYLARAGEVFQITRDHTLVQSLIDEGRITEEEAAVHPKRMLLLRALDGEHACVPDLEMMEAAAGDRYLLSSDGLHGVVSSADIVRVLLEVTDPDAAAADLVSLAIQGGAPDNVTVIVADVEQEDNGR
jgi:protein phosphatase